jgi:hypothetical protein
MMNDLIWIGNTLYPRWLAFAAFGLAALIMIGVPYALQMLIRRLLQRNRNIP